jgi:hypothetical protein
MLDSRATRADAALEQADQDSREHHIVLSRNIERREHERLLHDTVLNTLTALARAGKGDAGEAVGRCRHDVALMEDALSDPGDADQAGGRLYGSLLGGIEAVAAEMRARGLVVHFEVTGGVPGLAGVCAEYGSRGGALAIPVPVAAAIAHAVREALANVAAHAGTGEAWVKVNLAASGGEAPASGAFLVTVRDAGAGFDATRLDPARLGLRRSITERVADWGGQASIGSAPGDGTVVCLCWPRTGASRSGGRRGPHRLSGGPAMVSRDEMIRDAAQSWIPHMVGAVAAILPVTLLIQVLFNLHDYRQHAVPVAVWLGVLAAAAWLVPRARAGGITGAEAAVAVAVAVAAVVLVGLERRGPAGTVDWSILGVVWALALLVLSRPAWTWVTGALLVFAAHAVFVIRVLGVSPLSLARLSAAAYVVAVPLALFSIMRPALLTHAGIAARRAALASRVAAERAAAAAVQEDRRERLALLETEALPLLRDIAGGKLDPADRQVRERCARHTATLRHALTDRTQSGGGLLAELEPALGAARARGHLVKVQVVGDPGNPVREVADAALAAVDGVMSALPPNPVTLTVLESGQEVELYVTFDGPLLAIPDVAELRRKVPAKESWRAAVDVDEAGAGHLEVRWRKTVPA